MRGIRDEEGSGVGDVEEGEAVVAGVLHLPDALLEGGGELHRGGRQRRGAVACGGFGFDWAGNVRGVAVWTETEKFCKIDAVALSFVFDKYYPIIY